MPHLPHLPHLPPEAYTALTANQAEAAMLLAQRKASSCALLTLCASQSGSVAIAAEQRLQAQFTERMVDDRSGGAAAIVHFRPVLPARAEQ